jgi:hypothetical protein
LIHSEAGAIPQPTFPDIIPHVIVDKIPRMSVMVYAFNPMPVEKRNTHLSLAEDFVNKL